MPAEPTASRIPHVVHDVFPPHDVPHVKACIAYDQQCRVELLSQLTRLWRSAVNQHRRAHQTLIHTPDAFLGLTAVAEGYVTFDQHLAQLLEAAHDFARRFEPNGN